VRVQTEKLDDLQSEDVRAALAKEFDTTEANVSASFVGPSWGASVSQKALQALAVFLALVSLVMALYFRTWKMAVAGLVALLHDLFITVGIYALAGFEVSPATMIGFLTILGYSLYDTVVVFDKVRENTGEAMGNGRLSYAQAANLAVNQTLVRSINTTIVALLPIASILVVGFLFLGPGTLLDLALALFVGIAVGAYSSIFIATPLLVHMREREPAVVDLAKKAKRYQERHGGVVSASDAAPVPHGEDVDSSEGSGTTSGGTPRDRVTTPVSTTAVRETHRYAQSGPRNQPKRPPKSRR
jgi:preprotein translocase subunit SecF